MSLPSLRAVLNGVSPPRDGRSSLLQEIGLMPIRIAGMAAPFIVFSKMFNRSPVARELAPAGLRSSPESISPVYQVNRIHRFATASQPSGSKLPRHKSPINQLMCSGSGRAPGIDQFDEGALHLANQRFVVDFTGQP